MSTNEWRHSWRILPPSLAGIMLCAVHAYSIGVLIPPLEREFGWARAQISTGPLIISLIALFLAPLAGSAIDRFGPRRIALFGVPFFCGALALLSTANASIYSWWALWGLLAVAAMFVIPTVWTAAIAGYFDKNRGLALAVALCGTGITAAVVPTVTNLLLEAHGWRGAYLGLGGLGLVIVFPLTWFLFHAADSHKLPGAASNMAAAADPDSPAPARTPLAGVSARDGLTSPSFLLLAGSATVFSLALCALTTNAVPVLLANGMTPASAAGVAGLIGIGSIIGRLGGGYLLDRFKGETVAACSVLLPLIAIGLLLAMPGSLAAAGVAAVVLGLSVGTEVDACAYLAARHFGLRSFGTLFGAINGLVLFGNGLAPILANHVYDITRSYDLVLWSLIPACLASSLLFALLGRRDYLEEPEAPGPDALAAAGH